jgi:hypothetical protein
LTEIIADPDLVTELFDESERAPSVTMQTLAEQVTNDPMKNELIRRASEILRSSIGTMEPAMRELVQKSLGAAGIKPEDLMSGGSAKLLELMRQRAQAMNAHVQSSRAGGSTGAQSPAGAVISLEKAWHGVHYLMCGATDPGSTLLSQVVMGGTEVGEDLGYGPARYFEADKIPDIVRELTGAGLEPEIRARFDPAQMTTAQIYPFGWQPSDLKWVMDEFHKLRQFFIEAGAAKYAVITNLE